MEAASARSLLGASDQVTLGHLRRLGLGKLIGVFIALDRSPEVATELGLVVHLLLLCLLLLILFVFILIRGVRIGVWAVRSVARSRSSPVDGIALSPLLLCRSCSLALRLLAFFILNQVLA